MTSDSKSSFSIFLFEISVYTDTKNMFASKFTSPIFHIIVDILQVDDSYWRAIQIVKLTYIFIIG